MHHVVFYRVLNYSKGKLVLQADQNFLAVIYKFQKKKSAHSKLVEIQLVYPFFNP